MRAIGMCHHAVRAPVRVCGILAAGTLLAAWPAARTIGSERPPEVGIRGPDSRSAYASGHETPPGETESQARPTARAGGPDTRPVESLTLEQAVALALEHNRQIRNAQLETEKTDARTAGAGAR